MKPYFSKTIRDLEVVEGSAARFDCKIEGELGGCTWRAGPASGRSVVPRATAVGKGRTGAVSEQRTSPRQAGSVTLSCAVSCGAPQVTQHGRKPSFP